MPGGGTSVPGIEPLTDENGLQYITVSGQRIRLDPVVGFVGGYSPTSVTRPVSPPYAGARPTYVPNTPVVPPATPVAPTPSPPPSGVNPIEVVVSATRVLGPLLGAAGVVSSIYAWLNQGFEEAQARLGLRLAVPPIIHPPQPILVPVEAEPVPEIEPRIDEVTVVAQPGRVGVGVSIPDYLDLPVYFDQPTAAPFMLPFPVFPGQPAAAPATRPVIAPLPLGMPAASPLSNPRAIPGTSTLAFPLTQAMPLARPADPIATPVIPGLLGIPSAVGRPGVAPLPLVGLIPGLTGSNVSPLALPGSLSLRPPVSNSQCKCPSDEKKKKKAKRKDRTVCYKGTYYESAKGLTKFRKQQISCYS